jgi:hypothetical protein
MRIIWPSLEIPILWQFVMHANAPRVINCHLLNFLVCQRLLLILCFRMCGALPLVLLVETIITLVSLMISPNLLSCPETCKFRKKFNARISHCCCIHAALHYFCIVECLSYRICLGIVQLSNQNHLVCCLN